jgi:hypothetical protein
MHALRGYGALFCAAISGGNVVLQIGYLPASFRFPVGLTAEICCIQMTIHNLIDLLSQV